MLLLIASIAALFLGPVLVALGRRHPLLLAAVDGGIPILLVVFVGMDILPEALESAGPLAIVFLVAGLVLPSVAEYLSERASTSSKVALGLAVGGLGLHAMFDGAAIAMDMVDDHAGTLGFGIVLHRISDGASVVWLARDRVSARGTYLGLCVVGAATAVGYWFAPSVLSALSSSRTGLVQAFFGGALLHVTLAHSPTIARLVGRLLGRKPHVHAHGPGHVHDHDHRHD